MRKKPTNRNEYYHLYNRGVDKRTLFATKGDFDRFKAYLYLLNDEDAPRAANFFASPRAEAVYESARGQQFVAIASYCIMPTHFHIIARPLVENGVPKFMQKVLTAYTMYFNDRTLRSGSLFEGTYKRARILDDAHLKYAHAYIHLNAAQYFHTDWRIASEEELRAFDRRIETYPYSSAHEYATSQFVITSPKFFPPYILRAKGIKSNLDFWFRHGKRAIDLLGDE